MRSQVDNHIDIQEGAAWCATSLLVWQDTHPGVPESPLHIGLELLGGEACLCNLGAYGFNENPQALYVPECGTCCLRIASPTLSACRSKNSPQHSQPQKDAVDSCGCVRRHGSPLESGLSV